MIDTKQTNDMQPEETNTPEQIPEKQSFLSRNRLRIVLAASVAVLVLITAGVLLFLTHASNNTTQDNAKTQNTPSVTSTEKKVLTEATNTWKSTINPTAIPIGDGNVSTTPKIGYVYSCTTSFRNGAEHSGSWLNAKNGTWNSKTKVAVQGAVKWPNASYSVKESGSNRIITTNDLPKDDTTGIFPIALSDPAHQYDSNPNPIGTQNLTYTLPLNPIAASSPQCTGLGAIGVLINGALLYNGLDAAGRDAVAHETQDSCNGHPDGGQHYHYHDISSCILDSASGSSTLVGYALDGYGIYVERDDAGNLPTNADLDECHGRTSEVMWNGKLTNVYHYDATLEYPFTVGCFHGTPTTTSRGPKSI